MKKNRGYCWTGNQYTLFKKYTHTKKLLTYSTRIGKISFFDS